MKKKTELYLETEQELLIRKHKITAFGWCTACGARTRMVTAEEAAALVRATKRKIYFMVENNQLHFVELPNGCLLICCISLQAIQD